MPGTPGGPIGMRPRPLPRIPMPPRPEDERKRLWCLLLKLKLWPNVILGTREESLRLGTFSNDDGEGKEDVKKQKVYYAKQQLCTCITLFCTFLYRPCTTTTWKCLIASFMEDVNKRRRISFSLSKLECGPQEINSREIRLHLPFSANWNKHDKDWKNGNSF